MTPERYAHPSFAGRTAAPRVPPPAAPAPLVTADRACCCPAAPVVVVVMRRSATRPRSVELLLCGHHYRASRAALAETGAEIFDLTGAPVSPADDGDAFELGRTGPMAGAAPLR